VRDCPRAEARVVLEARPSSILAFEDFVSALGFLSPTDRDRLKVAGGEILDNIVKHSYPVERRRILARVRLLRGRALSRPSILLGFFFRSPGFAAFAAEDARRAASEPLYDPAHRRWRGIGLVMCRNLARRVAFRPGGNMDRIFLEFDAEEN
jgi:anti-sigma regulatory factor (Ser/Thr protein kinase)